MQPYQYPNSPHVHKHGPTGYSNYEPYRDWLRDEFSFRCVYCLHREKWGLRSGQWHIDHFLSQDAQPGLITTYENLLYSCAGCNLAKGNKSVANPCECMLHNAVEVFENGTIEAKTIEALRTIKVLGLDSPEDVEFRSQIIGIYKLGNENPKVFLEWMGFPTDLPDLTTKRCLSNTRPNGIFESAHARRLRQELPEYY